jgi:hypothetical protein
MLPLKKIPGLLFLGLFMLTACSSASKTSTTPIPKTPTPPPTAIKIYPTPASPGDSIVWNKLQVGMNGLEITQDYLTEYGSTRIPPEGQKFLWVLVHLGNVGQIQTDVPLAEHFSVLYSATELKPSYGHRRGYADYSGLGPIIFPDQNLDGWLRFDIPAAADRKDLRFVFLPESSHVGASFSAPNYPYADDKPIYVWNCAP